MSTDNKRASNARYEASIDRILLRIPKSDSLTRAQITNAARAAGTTVNTYILDAIRRHMDTMH